MKTILVLLAAGSLAFNLALVGVLFAGRNSRNDVSSATLNAAVAAPASPSAIPVAQADTWSKLRADDLPAMVQQLRDAGFPPDVVRAIMAAQLRELYAARIKALDPNADQRAFWKATTVDPRVQMAQSKLYREQQKLLRDLLGPDGDPQENINAIYQGRRLDSVPAEKVDDVRRLLREFDDARAELFSTFGGGMLGPDMQKKIAAVDKNFQDALARALTPDELQAYNLRNSDSARQVRGALSAFNPTEEEFRAVYKLQADFDERFGRMSGILGPDEQRRRSDAQQELNAQIKATLGPVRGAEYERATDFSYRQTSQLVARLELPPETTSKVWDVKQDVENRANEIRRDSSLPPEERTKRLAALAEEGTSRVTALVGQRGIDTYKQFGGYWLQNLTPRPRPAGTTTGTVILRGP